MNVDRGNGMTRRGFVDRIGLVGVALGLGGAAAAAGMRGLSRDEGGRVVLGDVITAIDGQPIGDLDDLYRTLDKRQIGDTISVTIFRDEKEVVLPIKLTQLPNMTRTRRDF